MITNVENRFHHAEELLQFLEIPLQPYSKWKNFPLLVTEFFASKMEKGNVKDPLLLQVFPQVAEKEQKEGFSLDAVGDLSSQVAPGLLHKYKNRALMITTGACAIHCRYCFRRHFPYNEQPKSKGSWDEAWDYLEKHNEISELILSGGDPLALSNEYLSVLFQKAESLSHLKSIRIHSRFPVLDSSRFDEEFLAIMKESCLQKVFVVHVNHANELCEETKKVFAKLRIAGFILLNQSVLLKDVNDSLEALVDLSEALFSQGVLPYYLNLLDKVQGAAHFWVSPERAKELLKQMQKEVSGYLFPRLMQEIEGEDHKTISYP